MILRTPPRECLLPPEDSGATLTIGYREAIRAIPEWGLVDGDVIAFEAGSIHAQRDCCRIDPQYWREALDRRRRMSWHNAVSLTGV